eukprot:77904-Rhodomonas_salina.4
MQRAEEFTDVLLKPKDGLPIQAHAVVLSSVPFFKARIEAQVWRPAALAPSHALSRVLELRPRSHALGAHAQSHKAGASAVPS